MNVENKIIIECLNTFGRVPEQWELIKMIKQLQSNWNSLREWLEKNYKESHDIWYVKIINKMSELERNDKE